MDNHENAYLLRQYQRESLNLPKTFYLSIVTIPQEAIIHFSLLPICAAEWIR